MKSERLHEAKDETKDLAATGRERQDHHDSATLVAVREPELMAEEIHLWERIEKNCHPDRSCHGACGAPKVMKNASVQQTPSMNRRPFLCHPEHPTRGNESGEQLLSSLRR
jgi:hypothetical protein